MDERVVLAAVIAPVAIGAGWLTVSELLRQRRARRSLWEAERVEMQQWMDSISDDDWIEWSEESSRIAEEQFEAGAETWPGWDDSESP